MDKLWRFPKDTRDELNKTRLPSGGWINLWLNIGHYEVTQDAAERFGFSSAAIDILRDAAQDPDFYEFTHPAAHAQSPDSVAFMESGAARDEAIEQAIQAYKQWVLNVVGRMFRFLMNNDIRETIYLLGYVLHAIQDLGPHGGMSNPEHAALDSLDQSPDDDPGSIQVSRYYSHEFLRHVREVGGEKAFDSLRNWDSHGNLSVREKKNIHGHGWDLSLEAVMDYRKGGEKYLSLSPSPISVRWPRERVFTEIVESLPSVAPMRKKRGHAQKAGQIPDRSKPVFQPLGPAFTPHPKAKWTVMVYMAGDDSNPFGIEYAVTQDLWELKEVGSNEAVHFLAQTDEWKERNSYRYRLRKDTSLVADRLAIYPGDLNTGRVSTLVDFVDWSVTTFPAQQYALVLWGHGSGHDDQDVYRLARGDISPRLAARLGHERMGFFGRTRRAILERNGPNKGYGFDSTATDFLDNRELKRALRIIATRLGKPLDLLGFDACLMANTEVCYQLRKLVQWVVGSEQTEPGDGWAYREAFLGLVARPSQDGKELGRTIVQSFGEAYDEQQTLSLIDIGKIAKLANNLNLLARVLEQADPGIFHRAAARATDLSPEGRLGYKDLGAFLQALAEEIDPKVVAAASQCMRSYKQAVRAETGPGTGLTIYLPEHYNPYVPGSTDALYQLMDFPMTCGWSRLLERVSSPPGWNRSTANRRGLRHRPFSPSFGGVYGMDRYNVRELLPTVSPTSQVRHWPDRSRRGLFDGVKDKLDEVLHAVDSEAETPRVLIFLVPGMMGSQLSDRDGHHGLLWIDPIGLAIGSDFPALRLAPDGLRDADPAVRIEAAGPVPLIYDRIALCLMAAFGRSVDYLAYDWRKSVSINGKAVGEKLARKASPHENIPIVLVAHSLGGLVAAKAIDYLSEKYPTIHSRISGLVAMGTPWMGSFHGAMAMMAQGETVRQFALMTKWNEWEIASICQTFWGLSDTLPTDTPDLLKPKTYAPGPISLSPYGAEQLSSVLNLKAQPPNNTFAVVSDVFPTVNTMMPKAGGFEVEEGPGDGTVPLWSATCGGTLRSFTVREKHATLPLNRKVVRAIIEQISAWTGLKPSLLLDVGGDEMVLKPQIQSADSYIRSLENMDREPLPVGTLASLLFLG